MALKAIHHNTEKHFKNHTFMRKHFYRLICMPVVAAMALSVAHGQEKVNTALYPDYSPRVSADYTLMKPMAETGEKRPDFVNNAATKYFPPIFYQVGGSCGSASRIGYMFTYEINRYRDLNAALPENQYPTHFTWLLTNSSSNKETMAIYNGVPNAVTYGGSTYSSLFGIQDCADADYGWMQGYDKWFNAMNNRLERNANFPISVESEEGREAVKNWLWNHNGNPDYPGGGVCGIGLASGQMVIDYVPQSANNKLNANMVTERYVAKWGPTVDHAMTIVGYDDNIEFDLDDNGVVGEKDKDEVGAWIVVNSWGAYWMGNGIVYCPYKNAVPSAASKDYYCPEIYYIRRNYRPLRTIKILMEYNRRSEIKLSAGVSADLNATEPDETVEFEHFRYAGDGTGATVAPEIPMLGRWADGELHHEPMEFGYDLTDLSAKFDTRKPLKYFFIIETKQNAIGSGILHSCSMMDYEFDKEGIETLFDIETDGMTIESKGKKTVISVVVKGESLNAPRNFAFDEEGAPCWEAPAPSAYPLVGYNLYIGNSLLVRLDADATKHVPYDGSGSFWQLEAIYQHPTGEIVSEKVQTQANRFHGKAITTNNVRKFTNSGFVIKDIFKQRYEQATIEYWIKSTQFTNYNQQIGPGWGDFMIHTSASRQLIAGWTQNNRVVSPNNALKANRWQHVAIVVNGNKMTAYVDGQKVGEVTGGTSGIGGFGDLVVGAEGTNGLTSQIDELRIWCTARSQREILAMMPYEVNNAPTTPGLLAEFTMNDPAGQAPTDATGRYTTEKLESGSQLISRDASFMTDKRTLKAAFELPAGPLYANAPIAIANTSSANAIRFEWINSDEPGKTLSLETPTYIFTKTGEKTVTLTATDIAGNTQSIEKTFTVEAMPKATPDFTVPAVIAVGKRVTFINNTTPAEGCAYEWTLTGTDKEKATTPNVAVTYNESGEYTVTLKATNAAGSTTCSKKITVLSQAPEAAFRVTPSTILKGETIQLIDETKNQPTAWHWSITNEAFHYVAHEANTDFTLTEPGVYNVTLAASNGMGSNEKTVQRGVVVCNADGGTGLNFSGEGKEMVSFRNPINPTATGSVTLEWWMYAKGNKSGAQHIGSTASELLLTATETGALSIQLGGKTFKSPDGFITPSEWHHYALVLTKGVDPNYSLDRVSADLYKDGKHFAIVNIPGKWPAITGNFVLGGTDAPMSAVIDELRVWNSALTQEEIVKFGNEPIADVAAAMADHKLALYADFNQNGGDVKDATTNNNTGTRTGFGPDGDAWTPSLGIFCMSSAKGKDLTATYLTNYQAPFLHTNTPLNPAADQYMELLRDDETSRWILENSIESGKVTTEMGVDTKTDGMMVVVTKMFDFAGELNDHKIYQTVTLPAGYYVFGAVPVEMHSDQPNYIVTALGQGLPNSSDLRRKALSYTALNNTETAFSLTKESEVSLGLVMNSRGEGQQHISRFYLEQKITNDNFAWTGIAQSTADAALSIRSVAGGISLSAATPAAAAIYTPSGLCVYRAVICGTRFVELPAGLYIANGKKMLVR